MNKDKYADLKPNEVIKYILMVILSGIACKLCNGWYGLLAAGLTAVIFTTIWEKIFKG